MLETHIFLTQLNLVSPIERISKHLEEGVIPKNDMGLGGGVNTVSSSEVSSKFARSDHMSRMEGNLGVSLEVPLPFASGRVGTEVAKEMLSFTEAH